MFYLVYECMNYFLCHENCVQGLSKTVVAAKMHLLTLLEVVGISLRNMLLPLERAISKIQFWSVPGRLDLELDCDLRNQFARFASCEVFICHPSSFQPVEMERDVWSS